jgi:hypothetical protein
MDLRSEAAMASLVGAQMVSSDQTNMNEMSSKINLKLQGTRHTWSSKSF